MERFFRVADAAEERGILQQVDDLVGVTGQWCGDLDRHVRLST